MQNPVTTAIEHVAAQVAETAASTLVHDLEAKLTSPTAPAALAADAQYQAFLAWQAAQDAANAPAKPVEYYVWLASGKIVTLSDADLVSAGSHVDGVEIVARYLVGA
jgi:hypothetical protein